MAGPLRKRPLRKGGSTPAYEPFKTPISRSRAAATKKVAGRAKGAAKKATRKKR